MKSGTHCSQGAVEDRRYLLVAHFVEIAEDYRLAVVFRQCENGLAHRQNRLLSHQIILRRGHLSPFTPVSADLCPVLIVVSE